MRLHHVISSLAVLAEVASSSAVPNTPRKDKECKCFPGDACWPSEKEWSKFNQTVNGRLIKNIPLGSPCHDPTYDAALCETLTSQWMKAPVQ